MNRDALRAVLQPFEAASPLPRDAFLDPAVLALEQRWLATSWIPVAHEADVPRPGDWVRAPFPAAHVVIVRGADLGLAALHAVCTHRGTLLCDGTQGRLPSLEIRCPYHGWTFATDGSGLTAPGAPLSRLRLTTRHGVVFVCREGEAAALDAGPPWLRDVGPLQRASRTDHEVAANWKLLVGNFQESHHFPTVHPTLEGRTPWARSSSVTWSDAWLGGRMALESETVSLSGTRQDRPFVAAPAYRSEVYDAWIAPLWLTSLQPDYLLTYRLAPLAVDRTLVVAEIHVHPAAPPDALPDVTQFWERTNAEDRAICTLQQRGIAAHPQGRSVYASSEDGLHAFERIVAARLLEELA